MWPTLLINVTWIEPNSSIPISSFSNLIRIYILHCGIFWQLSDLSVKSSAVFAVPPRHSTQVCLCLEIETAAQFSYDHIHVKFRFIIPDKCTVIDGDVEGSTQSSYRQRSGSGTWLIGFCHELNILCNHEYQFNGKTNIYLFTVARQCGVWLKDDRTIWASLLSCWAAISYSDSSLGILRITKISIQ